MQKISICAINLSRIDFRFMGSLVALEFEVRGALWLAGAAGSTTAFIVSLILCVLAGKLRKQVFLCNRAQQKTNRVIY